LIIPKQVIEAANRHSYPLLFATVSGAHLYGFPSRDSDWDVRGVHILPASQVVGLLPTEETITLTQDDDIELDLVTHDIRKFFTLLLRPNGYVLEQLMSPIVVKTSAEHAEVKALVPQIVTRHHAHHYLGFADNQWQILTKEEQPRVKPLLYAFRVLLTGIHLMRSGNVEANLLHLTEMYSIPLLAELIDLKLEGAEKQQLRPAMIGKAEQEFATLRERLTLEREQTSLPDAPAARGALNDLLVRVRLASVVSTV